MASSILFIDRIDAGSRLAVELKKLSFHHPLIIALPRGGVPVAKKVSELLDAPLDVLAVRKIGVPWHSELGVGALTENGIMLFNEPLMLRLGLTKNLLKETIKSESKELSRRVAQFRQGRPLTPVRNREVILIDDGLATGYTAAVAVEYLQSQGAKKVILAVPVASAEGAVFLEQYADQVICLKKTEHFSGVEEWYGDFTQTSDQEVNDLLSDELETSYSRELKKLARPFKVGADFGPLIEKFKDKKVVMLGEASHGTHEFYEWRAAISKELIEKHGFNFVAVEGDWPPCEELNQFVRNRRGEDVSQALDSFNRWPTWMWANREVSKFADWMRKRNGQTGFHGLDVYSLFDSMDRVVELLGKIDPQAAHNAKINYSCFDPYLHQEIEYAKSLFSFPEGCKEKVIQVLNDVLKKRVNQVKEADEILFDAIQNARIVLNAENYYRTMIEADERSWNVRDRHMMETLSILLHHYGPHSKGIVWEHNTHVGDYRATDMLQLGQVNVGGLAREKFGEDEIGLIGFSTFKGSVIASHAWSGPAQVLSVPNAHSESIEAECHRTAKKINVSQFFLLFDRSVKDGPLSEIKGHRAIGVVYDPKQERRGNYVPTSLSKRYDAFIYIDETSALHSFDFRFKKEEFPETWPTGQ